MNRSQRFYGVAALLGMIVLIMDGKTAAAGAQAGVVLCLKVVIPSLFPFFVLSAVLMKSTGSDSIPGLSVPSRLFGLPKHLESVLIPALLGGYPVGAQSVSRLFRDGALTKREAERMLAFCSNAGPAFLFGMVSQLFPNRWMVWALWGIHILGAAMAARCLPAEHASDSEIRTGHSHGDILRESVSVMGVVCGWIVLFRVVVAFLDRWFLWLLPSAARVAVIGLLELSNGCWALADVESIPMRFVLCSGLLAAGGVCVTMQTASVTKGLSLRDYGLGKLVQVLVSLSVSSCIAYRTALPLTVLLPLCFRKKAKKRGSNRMLSGV
ncbi:MAG: hypothetical protein SOW84_02595 [Candidatus Faecousia sp.]|nr:hypothetical protein [Candidatus Faecousia sp.]